ncbi:MAG: Flp pilus assembly complex ATPase component TadA [Planctomycetaceae bacterium]|jgi:type II secretory ATPase GspE/PulE/Tfp pilus assembly ATPase PilB-like protein|nr:Flp pilus assembly complex ATPase component TadA [Planctomycetaceae bacterium]
MSSSQHFSDWLASAEQAARSGGDFVVAILERILQEASSRNASDVHFQPEKHTIEIRFRLDGVLHKIGELPGEHAAQTAARLKVLANLLTYKTASPQEGRVRSGRVPNVLKEMRISAAPTLYGERIVVRFFSEENQFHYPDELGFSDDLLQNLLRTIRKNSGAVLITGPAGSGKTTTAYALLRELADRSETLRSIVTLEDPVEHALERVAQIEVPHQGELALRDMIKYMMRQDPEVLFVGEIRDRETAETSLQAALTGHLLITTFHAGSAADAVGRLCELGIEPFVLRSGISCVLCQRLVRRLCECAETPESREPLTLEIDREKFTLSAYKLPNGCPKCGATGYRGRVLIAESLPLDDEEVIRGVLDKRETSTLRTLAKQGGMIPMSARAVSLIESGVTSPHEIRRVFGGN